MGKKRWVEGWFINAAFMNWNKYDITTKYVTKKIICYKYNQGKKINVMRW